MKVEKVEAHASEGVFDTVRLWINESRSFEEVSNVSF